MIAQPTDTDDPLLTLAKFADLADVHPMTVRRWISEGQVDAVRVGPRLLRIRRSSLEAMLRPVPTTGGNDGHAA